MIDIVNPTSQFHPYQPPDVTPQAERMRETGKLNRKTVAVAGSIAAVAIGAGILLRLLRD